MTGGNRTLKHSVYNSTVARLIADNVVNAAGERGALAGRMRAHDAEVAASLAAVAILAQVSGTPFNIAAPIVPLLVTFFDPYRGEIVGAYRLADVVDKSVQVGIGEGVGKRYPWHRTQLRRQRIYVGVRKEPSAVEIAAVPADVLWPLQEVAGASLVGGTAAQGTTALAYKRSLAAAESIGNHVPQRADVHGLESRQNFVSET